MIEIVIAELMIIKIKILITIMVATKIISEDQVKLFNGYLLSKVEDRRLTWIKFN